MPAHLLELMDEYFESRPHLRGGGGSAPHAPNAQDRAQKALSGFAASNPKMASNMISSGIKSGAQSNPKSPWSKALSNDKVGVLVGRLIDVRLLVLLDPWARLVLRGAEVVQHQLPLDVRRVRMLPRRLHREVMVSLGSFPAR